MRRVAVTGFGVVSAVGNGREAFWRGLTEGKSGLGSITRFDVLDGRALLHIGTSLEVFDLRKLVSGGRPDFSGVIERSLRPERPPFQIPLDTAARCIAAAGAVEFGACLLALTRGVLPPNTSLERVGGGCQLNHVTRTGTAFTGEYALSNSFGFGRQNAALVLRRFA